jgi:hypothetical protein
VTETNVFRLSALILHLQNLVRLTLDNPDLALRSLDKLSEARRSGPVRGNRADQGTDASGLAEA